jgi:hypothetical protein
MSEPTSEFYAAAELKHQQTFELILPNLINKSKKRNLRRPAACRRKAAGLRLRLAGKNFPPQTPQFLFICWKKRIFCDSVYFHLKKGYF